MYPLPPSTIVNSTCPPVPFTDVPALTVIVSVVVAPIPKTALCIGSVALGYEWNDAWLSWAQVNVKLLVWIPIEPFGPSVLILPGCAPTNVCVDVSDDVPTTTVNVSASTLVIANHLPLAGSSSLG